MLHVIDGSSARSYNGDPGKVFAALATLLGLVRRPAWQRDALCLEYPDVSWFPERGESPEAAKAVCGRCAVRDECLAYGRAVDGPYLGSGVWGGLSPQARRALRRKVA